VGAPCRTEQPRHWGPGREIVGLRASVMLSKVINRARGYLSTDFRHEAFLEDCIQVYNEGRLRGIAPRVLYVALKYDYGDPRRGLSYEEYSFFHTLVGMGVEVVRFDFSTIARKFGRRRMNELLYETAFRYSPDLMFTVLFRDELDRDVVTRIRDELGVVVYNWFCDDHWRYEQFSSRWVDAFTWASTTSKDAFRRYQCDGHTNVFLTQWACNTRLCRRLNLPYVYDVSFIGQPHGSRRKIIEALRSQGISVYARGFGWPGGKVSQSEMVRIFNQSKINLNLSNSSVGGSDQIKGRDFEVPGCGGFLITGAIEELREYYDVGREVVCYDSVTDLIDKVRYYLAHEQERQMIAENGYRRVIRDHTYEIRLTQVGDMVGVRLGRREG